MVDWMVSWGTPLFVTYDELHSPNHSSFHILMVTTRGQRSKRTSAIHPESIFHHDGRNRGLESNSTDETPFENGASSNVSDQNLIIDSTTGIRPLPSSYQGFPLTSDLQYQLFILRQKPLVSLFLLLLSFLFTFRVSAR